ncbi:MAG TPA: hypothetical protein VE011_08340 [Candidatus Dormibacteraeota bacterium]|nr:hypothetical protein [Candidatus Dormibacteraeota bacterium]
MSRSEPVLHFSEDPSIRRFTPHVPRTNPTQAPAVWAIDAEHAPVYWFPRDCPRGAVWANTDDQRSLLQATFQTGATRVQATELDWLGRVRSAKLYVYELDRAAFEPWPDADGQWIARVPVEPIEVRPLGDVLELHARAGIELRFVPDIWAFWNPVIASGLPFSGIRLRNARVSSAHDGPTGPA